MIDHKAAAAVLEAALQTAVEGLKDAKARGDMNAMKAYHDILGVAYDVGETLDFTVPNQELEVIAPDVLMGMAPRRLAPDITTLPAG